MAVNSAIGRRTVSKTKDGLADEHKKDQANLVLSCVKEQKTKTSKNRGSGAQDGGREQEGLLYMQ